LDNGDLAQRFEHLGRLLHEKRFFPSVLAQQADGPQERMLYGLLFQKSRFK
jgi:hypothetical protein